MPIIAYGFSIVILSFFSYIIWNFTIRDNSKSFSNDIKISYSDLLKKSLPISITHLILFSLQSISVIILGLFAEIWKIGAYEIAFKISLIINVVFFAINGIAMPKYAEAFSKNNYHDLSLISKYSLRIAILVSVPIFLFIIYFATNILNIFGNDAIYAKSTLIILCVAQLFDILTGSVQQILQMSNNEKFFRNLIIFSFLVNICLNFILIPKYGINGAASAFLITIILWKIIGIKRIKNKFNFWTFSIYYSKNNNLK